MPDPCSNGGYVIGGVDVTTAEDALHHACGSPNVETHLFMDECGGHANPYHLHEGANFEECQVHSGVSEDLLNFVGRSREVVLMGFALDGHPIYARYNSGGELIRPKGLDACNGKTSRVPDNEGLGLKDVDMYHYYFTPDAPFSIGCYGPVNSLQQCKDMYPTCDDGANDGLVKIPTGKNGPASFEVYDTWCPCYQHNDGPKNDPLAVYQAQTGRPAAELVTGICEGVAREQPTCHNTDNPFRGAMGSFQMDMDGDF